MQIWYSLIMNIHINPLVTGASDARGIVVIIDVLRACTTISILFDKGVEEIIPVSTPEEADAYRAEGYILVGEGEHGTVHNIFHYNNSPSEVRDAKDLAGRKVVLRSNNATQAILGAEQADEIILASFLNYKAVVDYIRNKNPEIVTLVPLGRLGEQGLEDDLCAELMKAELEGRSLELQDIRQQVETCECAILVKGKLGKPEDVEMALAFNTSRDVPRLFTVGSVLHIKKA